jgi:hypothetical protein
MEEKSKAKRVKSYAVSIYTTTFAYRTISVSLQGKHIGRRT